MRHVYKTLLQTELKKSKLVSCKHTFKEKSDTKTLGEQGEGKQQEFEVKDLRKALPRSLYLTSMFGGGRGTSDKQHHDLPTQKKEMLLVNIFRQISGTPLNSHFKSLFHYKKIIIFHKIFIYSAHYSGSCLGFLTAKLRTGAVTVILMNSSK